MIIETSGRGDVYDLAGVTAFRDILVEVEILESLDLAKRVAGRLMADRDRADSASVSSTWPVFEEATDPTLTLVSVARVLQDRIEVEQVRREVGVVRIGARSTLPAEAQYIANAYSDEYASRNLEMSRSEAAGLKSFLGSQIGDRQQELVDAEDALQLYQEQF